MKPIALVTLIVALLGAGQALAGGGHGGNNGGYHGGGNNYHGGGNGYRGGYNGYYGHGGGYYYRPAYYRPAYYPYYGYGYGYHHNNNNNNDSAYYALGGLALGALLTNVYYQNRAPQPTYVQQTYQPAPQVVVVPQGRHLVRDLNGDCYERTTDRAGNELRTELPAANCNW